MKEQCSGNRPLSILQGDLDLGGTFQVILNLDQEPLCNTNSLVIGHTLPWGGEWLSDKTVPMGQG